MKKPKYAKVPLDADLTHSEHLTAGNTYKVEDLGFGRDFDKQRGFDILADSGNMIYCLPEKCAHLNKGNWELIYE